MVFFNKDGLTCPAREGFKTYCSRACKDIYHHPAFELHLKTPAIQDIKQGFSGTLGSGRTDGLSQSVKRIPFCACQNKDHEADGRVLLNLPDFFWLVSSWPVFFWPVFLWLALAILAFERARLAAF